MRVSSYYYINGWWVISGQVRNTRKATVKIRRNLQLRILPLIQFSSLDFWEKLFPKTIRNNYSFMSNVAHVSLNFYFFPGLYYLEVETSVTMMTSAWRLGSWSMTYNKPLKHQIDALPTGIVVQLLFILYEGRLRFKYTYVIHVCKTYYYFIPFFSPCVQRVSTHF